ncbi:MAG: inorganic pyrophosphatase [Clostridiaceae bacterium]
MEQNNAFWSALDTLIQQSSIAIDRPKGTVHPRYPDFVYPVDYGYLENTSSMDGGGIDVWLGSEKGRQLDAVMCIVDLTKRDSEIKLLIGCTEQEKELVFQVHNQTQYMKGILIRRK